MTSMDTEIYTLLARREARATEIEAAATALGRAYGDYCAAGDEIVKLAGAERHIDLSYIMDDVHRTTSNHEQLIGGILFAEGGLDIAGSRNGARRLAGSLSSMRLPTLRAGSGAGSKQAGRTSPASVSMDRSRA